MKRVASVSTPPTPKRFNGGSSSANSSANTSMAEVEVVQPKRPFNPETDGSSFESFSKNDVNTANFMVLGHAFLPLEDTKDKRFSVQSIFIVDCSNNIGEVKFFENTSRSLNLSPGDIVNIEKFGVDGCTKDGFCKITTKSSGNVSVNEVFLPTDVPLNTPNTYEEMQFAYSNCYLRYVRTDNLRPLNDGRHVHTIIFETEDQKKVQLSYWDDKIVQFPSFELVVGKVYQITGATKNLSKSAIYPISLSAHELTEIKEYLDEREDSVESNNIGIDKLPKLNKISVRDLGVWKRSVFTAITQCIENAQGQTWNLGVTDGSEADDGKTLAIACTILATSIPTIKKGDTFSCLVKVIRKDNNRHHGTLDQIQVIPSGEIPCHSKFI